MESLKYSRSKATVEAQRLLYFITIEKAQKKDYVTPSELDTVLAELNEKIPDLQIISSVYELGGKYYQLHSHIIVSTFLDIYFKKYSKFGNFRVWWKAVYNKPCLNRYMLKQCHNSHEQENLLMINHYRHQYGFV